tara:strand:- start:1092 stop:3107 length:2016 start_codon:yes stop_codon:yes gene_type:complete
MPQFYWILRDFALNLVNRQGDSLTEDEYLENALQTEDPHKNTVRSSIRTAFTRRALVTLPRPSNNGNDERLGHNPRNIAPRFSSGVGALRKRLFGEAAPMQSNGIPLSGKMYVSLCRHYTSVVQTDAVPVIRDSWSLLAAVQARDLRDLLLSDYRAFVDTLHKRPSHVIDAILGEQRDRSLAAFEQRAMQPIDAVARGSLADGIAAVMEEARLRLAADVTDDAILAVREVEMSITGAPGDAVALLERQKQSFLEKFGDDKETVRIWSTVACAHVVAWIPLLVLPYLDELDTLREEVQKRNERECVMQATMDDLRASVAAEFELQTMQLRQELVSKETEATALRDGVLAEQSVCADLRAQIAVLVEQRENDAALAEVARVPDAAAVGQQIEEDAADECYDLAVQLDVARGQSGAEKARHAETKCQLEDTACRLQAMQALHDTLHKKWDKGLTDLQHAEQRARENAETRVAEAKQLQHKSEMDAAAKEESIKALHTKLARVQDKQAEQTGMYDRDRTHMTDTISKLRLQCDDSQKRVLEIHKNMLDDIRVREERSREQQREYTQQHAVQHTNLSECTRQNDRAMATISTLKRQVDELGSYEIECKRVKTKHQQETLLTLRLGQEATQLNKLVETLSSERDTLRKQFIQQESELAVLRADKQLWTVKQTMAFST